MELSSPNIKKFLIFSQKVAFRMYQEKESPKKISYILGKGNSEKLLISILL